MTGWLGPKTASIHPQGLIQAQHALGSSSLKGPSIWKIDLQEGRKGTIPVGRIKGDNLSPTGDHKWLGTAPHLNQKNKKYIDHSVNLPRHSLHILTPCTWIEISWSSAGKRMVTPSTLSYCNITIIITTSQPPHIIVSHIIVILKRHLKCSK